MEAKAGDTDLIMGHMKRHLIFNHFLKNALKYKLLDEILLAEMIGSLKLESSYQTNLCFKSKLSVSEIYLYITFQHQGSS